MSYGGGMNHTSDLIYISLIISGVALVLGWLISYNRAERPTLGDVLLTTAMTTGFPAFLFICLLWAALG